MRERQLIAVAIDRDDRIVGHGGRAHRWQVFDVWPGEAAEPEYVYTIELAEHACLHEWHVSEQPERHPLHTVDVAIAGSAGEGVIRRLAERNTRLLTTAERNPEKAVKAYLQGTLPVGLPHEDGGCGGH